MNKKGFTLIELLVVVAIIGLLSSIVLASLNSARSKARDARRMEDLKQIQIALELYYDKYGSYPSTGGTGSWKGGNCITPLGGPFPNTGATGWIPNLAPEFMSILPNDPKPGGMYVCYIYTANGTTDGSADAPDYALFAYWTPENYTASNIPVAFRYPSRSTEVLFAIYSQGAATGW